MKSRQLWTRNLAFIVVVAVLGSLVTAGIVIGGSKVLTTKKYKKHTGIYASSKDGPIDVPPSKATLASLFLPQGRYAIFAKLYVENSVGGGEEVVTCRLAGGGSTVDSTTDLENDYDEFESMRLQIVGQIDSPGSVVFQCEDNGTASDDNTKAHFIKLTALRDRKITAGVSP